MLSQHEWLTAVCEHYLNPPVIVEGKELPGFPSDEIQTNTTDSPVLIRSRKPLSSIEIALKLSEI